MIEVGDRVVITVGTRDQGKFGIVKSVPTAYCRFYRVEPENPNAPFLFPDFFADEIRRVGPEELEQYAVRYAKSMGFGQKVARQVAQQVGGEKVTSHKQVTVPVFAQCDAGIAPLIFALGGLAEINTHFSCQGDNTAEEPRAWVTFTTSRRKSFRLLRHLQDGQNSLGLPSAGWELRFMPDGINTLFVEPKYISEIATVISSFCEEK